MLSTHCQVGRGENAKHTVKRAGEGKLSTHTVRWAEERKLSTQSGEQGKES